MDGRTKKSTPVAPVAKEKDDDHETHDEMEDAMMKEVTDADLGVCT